MVIWLIGLSGAGKTTVGRILVEQLRDQAYSVAFVDGDVLRDVWGDNPGHDLSGRGTNARRISQLCRFLDQQGITVVASVLSIFPDWQQWNRRTFSSYYEVFLNTPLAVVEARDYKGLYRAARSGEMRNVVGIDIPFPVPPAPDLVLSPPEILEPPDAIAKRILEALPEAPSVR